MNEKIKELEARKKALTEELALKRKEIELEKSIKELEVKKEIEINGITDYVKQNPYVDYRPQEQKSPRGSFLDELRKIKTIEWVKGAVVIVGVIFILKIVL